MSKIAITSETGFQSEVIEAGLPVIVDFTAKWCGPCKMLEPVVEQLAEQWYGKAMVFKLDVDENPNLAVQYQVMGVPTLVLFVEGKPVERISGYQPKDRIVSKFTHHL
jgi:thioredoxin 1